MKNNIISIFKVLCITFLLTGSASELFSQASNKGRVKYNGLFFGFTAGQSQSHIVNEGALGVSGLLSKGMDTNIGSFEIGYFFSRFFGLSTGIGFDAYKTQLTLDTYENKFITVDSENESYERRVSGTGIKELQEVDFLTVPLCLNFRIPVTRTIGLFMQADANVAIPVNNRYSSSGTFTYKGYYATYNVLLENLPDYGFPGNYNTSADGELIMPEYTFNAMGSAGIDLFLLRNIQISGAAFYTKSFSDVPAYTSRDKFKLSPDVDQLNSMMGGCSSISLESMGIKVSLRYFLRSPIRKSRTNY